MKTMSASVSRLVHLGIVLGFAAMVGGCGVDSESADQWEEDNAEGPPIGIDEHIDPCGGEPEPLPGTLVTITSLVFEDVAIGSPKSMSASIRNVGAEPVRLREVEIEGPGYSVSFAEHDIASLPWTIESQAELSYEVHFAPVDAHEALGELRWIYDRGESTEELSSVVRLQGNLACIEPWSGAYVIEDVAVGDSATLTVEFVSCSTVTDVAVLSIEMDVWDRGPDGLVPLEPNPFTIALPPLPFILRPGASMDLPVTFSPYVAGEFVAVLSLQTDISGGWSSTPRSFGTRVRAFGVE